MAQFLIACVLLLLATLQPTDACSCMMDHPQTHACKADFVILARILSRKPIIDPSIPQAKYYGYKLKITEVFKSTEAAKETLIRTRFVTTPQQESMCGVDLKIKQLYLITGKVYDGRAKINMCSYIQPWNHLSLIQRKGFRSAYYHNCDCQVKACWSLSDVSCPRQPNPQKCGWDIVLEDDRKDCQMRHGVCTRHENGLCSWGTNRYFSHCTTRNSDKSHNEATITRHYNSRIDP